MNRGWPVSTLHGAQPAKAPVNQALAALAGRQHGLVSLGQVEAAGLGPSGVRARVASGSLHRIHRGVYSVGHAVLSREGRWLAAVMAGGDGAVLSHLSAGELWGLCVTHGKQIDVTTPRRAGRNRAGISVHSGATLARSEARQVRRIPCTSIARTLLDLAEVVDRRRLERAVDQAEVLRVLDLRSVRETLSRAHGRVGAPLLSALLEEHSPGTTITRSELEERFLCLCTEAGLPPPEVNSRVEVAGGSFEVDFLWRAPRVIAETDGRQFHGTGQAFERDRLRDQGLLCEGWRVVRCTWRQVTREPDRLARTLETLLAPEAVE